MYTNTSQLLNPESEAIHHLNVCGGVYINYCYYTNYTYYSNILIYIIGIMHIMCWKNNNVYNSIGKR